MAPKSNSRRRRLVQAAIAVAAGALLAGVGIVLGEPPVSTLAVLPETLLDEATVWRYSDDGTDPAAGDPDRLAWTRAAYDDSAWKLGTGGFGAKSGSATPDLGADFPISTVLQQYVDPAGSPLVDIPTYHFRAGFDLTGDQLAEIGGLSGVIVYDDAVQVFVNGEKVAGLVDYRAEDAPDEEKNLTYAGSGNGDPLTSSFAVPSSILRAGRNTVAIALYQDRASSSDILLDVPSLVPLTAAPSADLSDVVLGVGSDESQRNLSWYSSLDVPQAVQFAPAAMDGGVFPEELATTVPATGSSTADGEQSRKATLSGLVGNTRYVYRVGSEGNWSRTYSFRTWESTGDYVFLFFGDPQVGSSGNVSNDSEAWADTLDVALAAFPESELLVSSGDQVETAGSETQYAGFLAPDVLRTVPLVPVVGNHDAGSRLYRQHFNVPGLDPAFATANPSASGGNSWFSYKDVLYIVVDSNSTDVQSNSDYIRKVSDEHGGEATWTVLVFHHSIYSSGPHADDPGIVSDRALLSTAISDAGVDLVLQGHDHSFARSYLMRDGEKANQGEEAGADSVVASPGDVLYVTANSATGSKYYSLQNGDADYLSVGNQERVRNYTVIEVTSSTLTVKTLRSEALDVGHGVNSVVDQVTVTRAPR